VKIQLMIPAAGMGLRLTHNRPKALVDLAGAALLVHTLNRFMPLGLVAGAVIVVPPGHEKAFEACLDTAFPGTPLTFAHGGPKRQVSVAKGLEQLAHDTDIVVIHDAARPFVPQSAIEASCEAAAECGAATVAIPCSDTILEADSENYLEATPARQWLWACQTPQTFRVSVIRKAHETARREGFAETDDASIVRRAGGRVKLVMGSPLNFKVTTPADLALAESMIERGLV